MTPNDSDQKALVLSVLDRIAAAGLSEGSDRQKNLLRYVVQEELEAREQPDTNSAAVEKFTIGTPLLVTGAVDDTWYAISYQEQTLYVPITSLQQAVESPELEQELQQITLKELN